MAAGRGDQRGLQGRGRYARLARDQKFRERHARQSDAQRIIKRVQRHMPVPWSMFGKAIIEAAVAKLPGGTCRYCFAITRARTSKSKLPLPKFDAAERLILGPRARGHFDCLYRARGDHLRRAGKLVMPATTVATAARVRPHNGVHDAGACGMSDDYRFIVENEGRALPRDAARQAVTAALQPHPPQPTSDVLRNVRWQFSQGRSR